MKNSESRYNMNKVQLYKRFKEEINEYHKSAKIVYSISHVPGLRIIATATVIYGSLVAQYTLWTDGTIWFAPLNVDYKNFYKWSTIE